MGCSANSSVLQPASPILYCVGYCYGKGLQGVRSSDLQGHPSSMACMLRVLIWYYGLIMA